MGEHVPNILVLTCQKIRGRICNIMMDKKRDKKNRKRKESQIKEIINRGSPIHAVLGPEVVPKPHVKNYNLNALRNFLLKSHKSLVLLPPIIASHSFPIYNLSKTLCKQLLIAFSEGSFTQKSFKEKAY